MISVSQLETRVRRLEQQLGSRHPQVAYLLLQPLLVLSILIAFHLIPFPLGGWSLGGFVSLWVVWFPFGWCGLPLGGVVSLWLVWSPLGGLASLWVVCLERLASLLSLGLSVLLTLLQICD